jgi:hypothetical protein
MELLRLPFNERHLSEQYFTSAQTFSHFFRQVNGRPQVAQIFEGSSDFFDAVIPWSVR